jgi:phenylacetate-coenzyme A ligase PaaK-like adenylate-forming protein
VIRLHNINGRINDVIFFPSSEIYRWTVKVSLQRMQQVTSVAAQSKGKIVAAHAIRAYREGEF